MTQENKISWQTKKIGEVCDIFNGGTPDTKNLSYWGGDHFWITPKDMGSLTEIYVAETPRKITGAGLKNSSAKILLPNSIILSSRAPIGYLAINKVPMATNQGCKGLVPKKELNYLFLFYFLFSSVDLLNKLGSGTTFKELSGSKLADIEIPLPPIPEQRRIVKILDEVFGKAAKAKENAEKNLQNAEELFESYLNNIFANQGKDWEEKKFDEILESNVIGLVKNTKEQSDSEKYKYVKMNNITRDNNFDFSKYTRVSATRSEIEKYRLAKGDFLFNTRNSYELVGKTCIFEGDDEKDILFNNNIMRVRFIKTISSYFINYAFSSRIIINKITHLKSGTTNVSAIYYKDLKNLILPIPPFSEQKSIVKKLDALSAETKKLEVTYRQKLADLEELKKSVLKKAFSGEL